MLLGFTNWCRHSISKLLLDKKVATIVYLFFVHPNYWAFHFLQVCAISSRKMLWIHWFDQALVSLSIQPLLRTEVTLKASLSSFHAFLFGFWKLQVIGFIWFDMDEWEIQNIVVRITWTILWFHYGTSISYEPYHMAGFGTAVNNMDHLHTSSKDFSEQVSTKWWWEMTVIRDRTFRIKSNQSSKLNLYLINFVLWRSNDVTS